MTDPERVLQCALVERLVTHQRSSLCAYLHVVSPAPDGHYQVSSYYDIDPDDTDFHLSPKIEQPQSIDDAAKRYGLE